MKAGRKIISSIFLLSAFSLTLRAQNGDLPQDVKTILDKRYARWQFDFDFNKLHKNLESVTFPVLSGDWNADGKTDYVVFIKHLTKAKAVIFLKIEPGYLFYEASADKFAATVKMPENRNSVMNNNKSKFYKNLPQNFKIPSDDIGLRIFREYGAMFVAAGGAVVPRSVVFKDELEVQEFQAKVEKSKEIFGTLEMELQTPAMNALKKAVDEARKYNLTISPKEADSARRSYRDTLELWESRVTPGLLHWVTQGRLDFAEAVRIRNLEPVEQITEIFKLEDKGMYFAKNLSKPIMYSVAPPGTSQHLSMLALDIIEHENPQVRAVLSKHGWFQTVISDLPHFTFLGVNEGRLPELGLRKVENGGRYFWIPEI
jgi:hypothetical protein